MAIARALSAPSDRLRPHQLIEIYHAATNAHAGALKPKSAAHLAGAGYLHMWFLSPREARFVVTRKGWQALKRDWRLIADKVYGYPGR